MRSARDRRMRAVYFAIPVLATVAGSVIASRGNESDVGSWGLIQALPPLWYVAPGVLTLSFFATLFLAERPSRLLCAAHLAGLVVLLHGAPGFLHNEPRFATAWLHVGFTGHILRFSEAATDVDARFSWPAFFVTAATLAGASGLHSALAFLRWAPILVVWAYLPSLYAIGRHLTDSPKATWLGLWLFVLVNWVGQDYFAPQSLGVVMYFAIVAILVACFRSARPLRLGPLGRLSHRWFGWDGRPDVELDTRTRILLVGALVLASFALAMSHQLTPIMLAFATTLLVIVGRLRLFMLPVVVALFTLGWISIAAKAFWLGHLDTIFGGVGEVDNVVGAGVGARIGGSVVREQIVNLRVGTALVTWILLVVCFIALWIARRPPLTLAILAVAPMAAILQHYGDEGVLRIFLFSCPFATLVIAQALVTLSHARILGHVRRFRPVEVVAMVTALALVPVFLIARYGNESFERVTTDEVKAVTWLYDEAPDGSVIVSVAHPIPWRFVPRSVARAGIVHQEQPHDEFRFIEGDLAAIRDPTTATPTQLGRIYLIVTSGTIAYVSEFYGYPADWFDRLQPLLVPANGYHMVFHNPDAVIYEFEPP